MKSLRSRLLFLLMGLATLGFASACQSTNRSEHEEFYHDSTRLRQRWDDIASPETAPDYYGRPASAGADVPPPAARRTPTGY